MKKGLGALALSAALLAGCGEQSGHPPEKPLGNPTGLTSSSYSRNPIDENRCHWVRGACLQSVPMVPPVRYAPPQGEKLDHSPMLCSNSSNVASIIASSEKLMEKYRAVNREEGREALDSDQCGNLDTSLESVDLTLPLIEGCPDFSALQRKADVLRAKITEECPTPQ